MRLFCIVTLLIGGYQSYIRSGLWLPSSVVVRDSLKNILGIDVAEVIHRPCRVFR